MQLPNAEHAIIPPEKLRDYVLYEVHIDNKGRARVFAALGYSRDDWERLSMDLREQHLTQEAVSSGQDVWGVRYKIIAPLTGPSGTATIESVWQVDHGSEVPRFITAYPE